MVLEVTNSIRRSFRAFQRAGQYPLLLPHHRVTDTGLQTFDRTVESLSSNMVRALRMCDGTQTLAAISRVTGVSRHAILEFHEQLRMILWRSPIPATSTFDVQPRDVIVSPHPDDASLCLGGMMLAKPPGAALVLDIFMQTGWTRFPTELNEVSRIQSIRSTEEHFMARIAGARLHNLNLPEALLRQHMLEDVFSDDPSSWDQEVQAQLRTAVSNIVGLNPDATWYLPLAIGNHLDHRIVRDVTFAALIESMVGIDKIRFYEDLPYACSLPGIPDFSTTVPGKKLTPQSIDIEATCRWKLELNRIYWSQLSHQQLNILSEYAHRIGRGRAIERVWKIA